MTTHIITVAKQGNPGPPGPISVLATTPTALTAVDTTNFLDLSIGGVSSLQQNFRLVKASVAIPDGTTVIAATPAGNWIALPYAQPLGAYLVGISTGASFANDWATIQAGQTLTIWTLPGTPLSQGEQVSASARIQVQSAFAAQTITDATNATPIVITVTDTTKIANGSLVQVSGVVGNTGANGGWPAVPIDGTHASLTGSVGNGAYVSGGFFQPGDFGHFTRDIEIKNNLGHISTPINTTSDFDITQPPPTNNVGPSLIGCAAYFAVVGGTLVTQCTAPAGTAMRARIPAGIWSRGPQPGTGPAPSGVTLGLSGGSTGGGAVGPTSPGYTVPVSGAGFTGAVSVTFNGVPASFVFNNDSSITATPGAGSAGSGVCAVTTINGTGFSAANSWTYFAPPTIAFPSLAVYGKYEGGDILTGTGTNLTGCAFTANGITCTGVVIGGGGTTFSFVLPASTGSIEGGYVTIVAINAAQFALAILSGVNGLFYLATGTDTLFDPTRSTTPSAPSNGANVSAWADVSGVGNYSTSQGTTNNQPVFVSASACNNQPAIRTTKAGGPGAVAQVWPIANGVIPTPVAQTQWTMVLVGSLGLESNTDASLLEFRPAGGGEPRTFLQDGQAFGGPTVASVINGTANASIKIGFPMTLNAPHVVSLRHDATTAIVRIDGVDGNAFADTTSLTFGQFSIGGGASTDGQWDSCLFLKSSRVWTSATFSAFSVFTNHVFGAAAA